MVGNPGLAPGDDGVVHLPRAREGCERLLADRVPVDEVHPRGLHRHFHTGKTRDQIERQVEPRGSASRHHQTLSFAGDHQSALRVDPDARIAPLQGLRYAQCVVASQSSSSPASASSNAPEQEAASVDPAA